MSSEIPIVGEKGGATPPTPDTVGLRTYLESLLDLKIAMILQRMDLTEKALQLQAHEYERRLEDLNHSHAQQVADRTKFLPREVFDSVVAEWTRWREPISLTVASVSDTNQRISQLGTRFDEAMLGRAGYIPREVYEQSQIATSEKLEAFHKELFARIEANALRIEASERHRSNMEGRITGVGVGLSVLVFLLNWAIAYFMHR